MTDCAQIADAPRRLLDCKEVLRRIPYSKTALYAMIRAGEFPKPVSLGANRVAWVESEVEGWIAARIKARDAA